MQLDPDYLRQHYASLSDEALLAIDRADLVEMAQMIFDDEVGRRKLAPLRDNQRTHGPHIIPGQQDVPWMTCLYWNWRSNPTSSTMRR